MSIELKNTKEYKAVINSLIITSGMNFDDALNTLLDMIATEDLESYIELLVDRILN